MVVVGIANGKDGVLVDAVVAKAVAQAIDLGCSCVSATYTLHVLLHEVIPMAREKPRSLAALLLQQQVPGKKDIIGVSLADALDKARAWAGLQELKEMLA